MSRLRCRFVMLSTAFLGCVLCRGAEADGDFPTPGADVIVASLTNCQQFGRIGTTGSGTVGLALGTRACNKGTVALDWHQLPDVRHPLIGQNLYRLRTVDGSGRFEQIGQSWLKHGFTVFEGNECGFGCTSSGTTTRLGVGCSDPYGTSTNAVQCNLSPRSAVHPYTGVMAAGGSLGSGGGCGDNFPSRNHIGHFHDGTSHRMRVLDTDLMPPASDGARYFGEGFYITSQEFTEGNGNQFNNCVYREYTLMGPNASGVFTFSSTLPSFSESPAIDAWEGATQVVVEPAPGVDGRAIVAYEVTDLGDGTWHYEYAIYNMTLDRSIRAFSVPLQPGVSITNIGFHAPLNHPEETNADTYSNDPWTVFQSSDTLSWSTDVFVVNPLANAVRYGTMYNFRFDADGPPTDTSGVIGFFKISGVTTVTVPTPTSVPRIVHGESGVSFSGHAFSGYIDPRIESNNGVDVNLGISSIMVRFNEPVVSAGGLEPVGPGSFVVRETGTATPPTVIGVSSPDDQNFTVQLSRVITLREWTTIEAHVENFFGVPVTNLGDLGSTDEPDRIDIAFLPGDVNQSSLTNPLDLLKFKRYVNGLDVPTRGVIADYVDTNRVGGVNPLDLLAFKQVVNGIGNTTRAWSNVGMLHARP